jgi:serine/threonine protein kinase
MYKTVSSDSLHTGIFCASTDAALTAKQRILVLSDVARGLAYLHKVVHVIHRDVKSDNVLLDHGCVGRIGDFGIAKCVKDHTNSAASVTATHLQTQQIVGTLVYMAPEYKNGEVSTKVDVFALGLVILEALTGTCAPMCTSHFVPHHTGACD